MLIEKFIDYLQIEKNYSSNTLSAYKKDLIEFKNFINENFDKYPIEHAEYKAIRLWIVDLVNKNLSNRSINRKVSSLKSFYKFLVKTDTIGSSPLLAHSPLKQSKKIQVPFSKEEINSLLDSDSFKNDFRGVLQKTIITFFYFTGVRRIELINIKESDINMDSSTIRIMGKRSKERIIPMLPKLKKSIVDYLYLRSQEFNKKTLEYLFVSRTGNQLSEKYVYRTVNEYFKLFSAQTK